MKSLRNEFGFSIPAALIGVSLVSVGMLGLIATMHSAQQTMTKASSMPKTSLLLKRALQDARLVLFDVGTDMNRGICRTLTTPQMSGGVGLINMDIFPASDDRFADDFRRVFQSPYWTPVANSSECQNSAYRKCYEPMEGVPGARDLMDRRPLVEISLQPVQISDPSNTDASSDGRNVEPLRPIAITGAASRVDAINSGYLIRAVVHMASEDGQRSSYQAQGLGWTGETACRYIVPRTGLPLLLRVSSIGSGFDPNTLFSSTLNERDDRILDVDWFSEAASSLSRDSNGSVYVDRGTANAGNLHVAQCSERRFRCRNRTAEPRTWLDGIRLRASVRYNPLNPQIAATRVQAIPRLCFGNYAQNGREENVNPQNLTQCGRTYWTHGRQLFRDPAPILTHTATARRLLMEMRTGQTPSENLCNNTCTPSGPGGLRYNSYDASSPDAATARDNQMRAYLVNQINELPVTDPRDPNHPSDAWGQVYNIDDSESGLACVCCHTKQCQRLGLGTYGLCTEQPPEPLDSRYPECASDEPAVANTLKPFETFPQNTLAANQCVKAERIGNTLYLSSENCTRNLPAVCYYQGGYRVSKDSSGSVSQSPYATANRICHDMGQETISRASVQALAESQGTTDRQDFPRDTDPYAATEIVEENGVPVYKVYNAASVGSFTAPQTSEQWQGLIEEMNSLGVDEAFVALKTDSSSKLRARIPTVRTSPANRVIYFEGERMFFMNDGRHGYQVHAIGPGTTATPGQFGDSLLLMHSPRYFGTKYVHNDQTNAIAYDGVAPFRRDIAAICFRPDGTIFKTTGTVTRRDDALSLCRSEGGLFLPPETPMHWNRALTLVHAPDDDKPFPHFPSGRQTSRYDRVAYAAWVSFQRNAEYATTEELDQDSAWSPLLAINNQNKFNIDGENRDALATNYVVCRSQAAGRLVEIVPFVSGTVQCNGFNQNGYFGRNVSFVESNEILRAAADVVGLSNSSAVFSLIDDRPITISSLNIPSTSLVNQDLTLSVSANSPQGLPINYQWYRNGVAIAGATSSSLTISGSDLGTAGSAQYHVVLTDNMRPAIESNRVTVNIVEPTPTPDPAAPTPTPTP